jgi:IMP and pyridine-specific 5'-nucleotidase
LSNIDIRRLLATAQLLALTTSSSQSTRLRLITFDGDVTLYPDGSILTPENPVIEYILSLLSKGIHIGIVTAAGYPHRSGKDYATRLSGLLEAISQSSLPLHKKTNLAILGGECNYLFRFNGKELEWIDENIWKLDEMKAWKEQDIKQLLDTAERALRDCAEALRLKAKIIRKEKAVGNSGFNVIENRARSRRNKVNAGISGRSRSCVPENTFPSSRLSKNTVLLF